MRYQLPALLLIPLLAGAMTSPAFAGSRTAEGVSQSLASVRSMRGTPGDAIDLRTDCTRVGPTNHYRCTTSWSD